MLVYGHRTFRLNVARFTRELARRVNGLPVRPSHDALVYLLVDFGEAEAAVADERAPREDDAPDGACAAWHRTAAALADAYCASARGDDVAPALTRLRKAVGDLDCRDWPATATARTAEGFAHYALFPEQYIAAVDRLLAETRPASLIFIGLRSIGSILAQVAAAASRGAGVPADVVSVRPRGHPFDRRLAITPKLADFFARSAASRFAIVDEGPGLSGSSFAAAADRLASCGIEASRIVFLPAWEAGADRFVSDRGRRAWAAHRHFVVPFTPSWTSGLADLSAGRWRPRVLSDGSAWPPVQPQHERRKYLEEGTGAPVVFRFAGLGRYGTAKHARATALAAAGFGPDPVALRDGFLGLGWMTGSPLTPRAPVTAALLDRLADYAAFVRRFEIGMRDDVAELARAAVSNVHEAIGPHGADIVAALGRDASLFAGPRVAVDGRLLPHEWIETAAGLVKTDALDHHADDFLPGCRHVAWDLAGASVEFALRPAEEAALVGRYIARSGDRDAARQLPFYSAAYLGYRFAYATLCADTLGPTKDGIAFRRLARRYRRSLAGRLRCRPAGPRR